MTDITHPDNDDHMRVPNTSLLPPPPTPTPAVVGLLERAVRYAHDTIDRFAARATPRVQRLGQDMAGAETAVQATASQLGRTGAACVQGLRSTVRSRPLLALAAAVGLGLVLGRLRR